MNSINNEKFKQRLEQLEKETHQGDISLGKSQFQGRTLSAALDKEKRSKKVYQIMFLGLLSFNMVYFGIRNYVPSSFFASSLATSDVFSLAEIDALPTGTEDNYDPNLLRGMGAMMEDLGYLGLTPRHLAALRDRGLTATFVSQMHNLGYTNLTLDELVKLSTRDVSSRFVAMMQTLGYTNLTASDLANLKDNGVTAYFTSNLHDLGYKDISIDDLIRLKNVGVSINTVKSLIQKNGGQMVPLEDILRYQISNQ